MASGLLWASGSHAGFIMDGVISPEEEALYTKFETGFGDATTPDENGAIWIAMDAAKEYIYLAVEIATSVRDLTFGDNAAQGWYDDQGDNKSKVPDKLGKLDEKWEFCFGAQGQCDGEVDPTLEKIQVKFKEHKGDGYQIKDYNKPDIIVEGSTSLDYNLRNDLSTVLDGHQSFEDFIDLGYSPECGDVSQHTTDQECYETLLQTYDNYQVAYRVELQISNTSEFFMLQEVDEILPFINDSTFKLTPAKPDNEYFYLPCLDAEPVQCAPFADAGANDPLDSNDPLPDDPADTAGTQATSANAVPLPSTLSLVVIASLVLLGRRREQLALAAA